MYSLKNLSSRTLTCGELPWDFKPKTAVPEGVRKNKKARDQWINDPKTDWCVWTMNEGVNPNMRISAERTDGEGNPVRCTYALVADYDSPQTWEKVRDWAKGLPFVPNRIERTLSGNWRFCWWLEEAIIWPSAKFFRHFQTKFAEFAFDVRLACPGFDESAWTTANRMWTNGAEWYALHDEAIPATTTRGWAVAAGRSYRFTDKEFGQSIPLEEVKGALEAKYPEFKKWDGLFELGAQGPTFWVEGSFSPKSATVREQGLQTYAAHAVKGFFTWADLLGIDFVKTYQANKIGRAVEEMYFDGHDYWRISPAGGWVNFNKDGTLLHLEMSRGLSSKPQPDGRNEVKEALEHIHNHQRVAEACPIVYAPSGMIFSGNKVKLNTSTLRVLAPAEGDIEVFGPEGSFPWISKLMGLFPDGRARDTVLAWTAWAYQHAYILSPVSGQVLFLCGPAGTGKSLWSRGILAKIFGGFAEANAFLTGEDSFNREMFTAGLWCLDDGTPSASAAKRQVYSHMLKRVAANDSFRVNGKFLQASTAEWSGRLCVTLNDDEDSVRLMPDATVSNKDKLILIRTSPTAPVAFPVKSEIEKIISVEAPHFCRWLLNYQMPASVRGANRFGVEAFHDSSLLEISEQASPLEPFRMIVELWAEDFFKNDPQAACWEGGAIEMHRNLIMDPFHEKLMRSYNVTSCNSRMRFLEQVGVATRLGAAPRWRIRRENVIKTP